MSPDALRFDDVTFRYPDAAVPAITDVRLSIEEGTFALGRADGAGNHVPAHRQRPGAAPQAAFSGRVPPRAATLAHPPRRLADVVAFVRIPPPRSSSTVEDDNGMENLRRPGAHAPAHSARPPRHRAAARRSVRTVAANASVAIAPPWPPDPRILVLDEPTSQARSPGRRTRGRRTGRLVHDQGLTVLLAGTPPERVARQTWRSDSTAPRHGRTPADVMRTGLGASRAWVA